MSCSKCNGKGSISKRFSTHKVPCPCCSGRTYGCSCTREGASSCRQWLCRQFGGRVWSKQTETRTVSCDKCGGSGGGGSSSSYSSNNSSYSNNNYAAEQERSRREEREREAELQRQQEQHQAQILALQRQREAEQRRYTQQLQEAARQQEIERKAKVAAQQRAEEERLENERIKKEREREKLLSSICICYMQLSDILIPNVNRLCLLLENKYGDEYERNYGELCAENNRLNEYHIDVVNDSRIYQLVMLGATGHGKSTFGNRLSGIDNSQYGDTGPFTIDHSTTDSVTDRIKKYTRQDLKISIIDTPGIFDSYGHDNFHLNKVIEYLRGTNGINAFLIVCKAGRLDIKYQELLFNLESMLTSTFWSNVIFVVTWCQ